MPRGGVRPGAGRKKTRERFARPVEVAEKRISDRLPDLIDLIITMAEGGDFKAASYLVDRVMGKPRQSIDTEVSGPDGGPIPLTITDQLSKVYGDGDG